MYNIYRYNFYSKCHPPREEEERAPEKQTIAANSLADNIFLLLTRSGLFFFEERNANASQHLVQ
jgi:hypothetical protein